MLPAYCLVIALLLYECARLLCSYRAPFLAGVAGLTLELVAIVLSTVLPVFKLPAPAPVPTR